MCFVKSGRTASGVTSRPVTPVPPVTIAKSTRGSLAHPRTIRRMAACSSLHILRSATVCPAAVSRSQISAPDLSESKSRVSLTARTATRTGTNSSCVAPCACG
ncbi:MAG: hypothetical protein A3I06_04270 [Candidatus Lindowbacteria bacterium RIFCSPLOWO2_02_FULL_62_12]|nr:MAG: hypothetical protein A3I06_04270 [Candidatus Lindowbacteria bacterium RIFCSPLOWO2_02_FULL_62_12]